MSLSVAFAVSTQHFTKHVCSTAAVSRMSSFCNVTCTDNVAQGWFGTSVNAATDETACAMRY